MIPCYNKISNVISRVTSVQSYSVALEGSCQSIAYRSVVLYIIDRLNSFSFIFRKCSKAGTQSKETLYGKYRPQKLFPQLLILQGKWLENPLALQQNLLALHFCMIMSSPDWQLRFCLHLVFSSYFYVVLILRTIIIIIIILY